MFEAAKHWWRDRQDLKKLDQRENRLRQWSKEYSAKASQKANTEVPDLEGEQLASGFFDLREEHRRISDKKIIRKALRLGIPIPRRPKDQDDENECWEWWPGGYYLTEQGEKFLRDEMRHEQKERRDMWLGWVPLVTAIAGLVGAATGFVAVLSSL